MACAHYWSESGRDNIEFCQIDPVNDARWSRFINSHPDASVFHTPEWLRVLQQTYGFQCVAYVATRSDREVASGQVFCRVKSWLTGNRLVSVPFSDHAAILGGEPDELRSLVDQLRNQVALEKLGYVEFRPVREDLASEGCAISQRFYLHKICLEPDLDSLYRKFHKDCVKRVIKRAERENLAYVEGSTLALMSQFYRLLVLTRGRQHRPSQTISWFMNLASCMGSRMQLRIAYKDEKPIAGIITLSHGRTMMYKYGCSDAKFHSMGGMAFLLWKAIQDAKEKGMCEFDLGRSEVAHEGLIRFKEHWGAERIALRYWRYPTSAANHAGWTLKIAKPILAVAPPTALQVVGNLLYKHMA